MLESTKKNVKIKQLTLIVQIALIVAALIVWLVCLFAVGKDGLGFAPIWMLFIVYFLGCFLFYCPFGIIRKAPLSIVAGGITGVIGLEILLFCVANTKYWYVWIIIGLILLVVCFLSTFLLKADTLTVEFDNQPDSGRKTYKEKMAEKAAQPAEEEKPLPEIKSFKNEDK